MECPKCGVANRDDVDRCRMCGTELRPKIQMHVSSKECPFCKVLNEVGAPFCKNCNKLLGEPTKRAIEDREANRTREKYYDRTYADYPSSAKRTAWCSVGGIIMIMVAMVLMVDIVFTIAESYRETQMEEFDRLAEEYPVLKSFMANIVACQSIRAVFAILAFVGGLASVRRLNFGLAIIGGIFGVVGLMMSISALVYVPWLLVVGLMFLAELVGLGMVVVSRREFMLT